MKKNNIYEGSVIYSLLNITVFFALRYIWSGIINAVGLFYGIIPILGALLFLSLLASFLNQYIFKKRWILLPLFVLNVVFSGLFIYMLTESKDYINFFLLNVVTVSLFFIGIYVFVRYVLYLFTHEISKRHKEVSLSFLLIFLLFGIIKVLDLGPNYFVVKPVVYAVEETYQIVFITKKKGEASVVIDNDIFYESEAGSSVSHTKLHKIVVPMHVLDTAGTYTVQSTPLLYRGPYNGVRGKTIKHSNSFRAIDDSDGINFHVGSDFHDYIKTRAATYLHNFDELDFVVMAGDIASFLETNYNVNFVVKSARDVSKGEIAVIHTRGNHDTKGEKGHLLSKVTGSVDTKFYYTVTLGPLYLIVLDLGESDVDAHWEFYNTAFFDEYRAEELLWLNEVKARGDYLDPRFSARYVITHQPISFINYSKGAIFLKEERLAFVNILNTMNIDASFSGHFHGLYYVEETPLGPLSPDPRFPDSVFREGTGSTFPEFVTSKRSLSQFAKEVPEKAYTSLRVRTTFLSKNALFLNNKGENVSVITPLTGITYQDTISF